MRERDELRRSKYVGNKGCWWKSQVKISCEEFCKLNEVRTIYRLLYTWSINHRIILSNISFSLFFVKGMKEDIAKSMCYTRNNYYYNNYCKLLVEWEEWRMLDNSLSLSLFLFSRLVSLPFFFQYFVSSFLSIPTSKFFPFIEYAPGFSTSTLFFVPQQVPPQARNFPIHKGA